MLAGGPASIAIGPRARKSPVCCAAPGRAPRCVVVVANSSAMGSSSALRCIPPARSDTDISALARATHQTVYHVSGTCRIGAPGDALAVVDPGLRVYGVPGLRVADASVFPTIPSVNPVVTVMMTAERAADLIRQDR